MSFDNIPPKANDTKPGFPCPKPKCTGRWYPYKPMAEHGEIIMGKCTVCGEFRARIEP